MPVLPPLCLVRVERVGGGLVPARLRAGHVRHAVGPEVKLQEEGLAVGVPTCPELALCAVHLLVGQLEGDGLVWLGGEQQILKVAVWGLNALFKGGHETMAGQDALANFGIVDLEEEAEGARLRVLLLGGCVVGRGGMRVRATKPKAVGQCGRVPRSLPR